MSGDLNNLKERFSGLLDEELLKIVSVDSDEYRKETLDIVKEELRDRGFQLIRGGADFEAITPTGIKLTRSKKSPIPISPSLAFELKYKGIRGWLAWFIITLIILNPLFGFGRLALNTETKWSELKPYFETRPILQTIYYFEQAFMLAFVCLSIYVGVTLWKIKPGAVRLAKTFLLTVLAVQVILPFSPLLAGFSESANEEILYQAPSYIFQTAVYSIVWFLYLTFSKRVAATYKSNFDY